MSFDFSRIAELSTARGKLVELKNSAGRVIWAVQSGGDMATVTIIGSGGDASKRYITIDGVKYLSDATIEVPMGTVIGIHADGKECKECGRGGGAFYLNGSLVSSSSAGIDTTYTINGNISVTFGVSDACKSSCDEDGGETGSVKITEE